MGADLHSVRSLLFLPASNPRAIAKARTLAADLVILDLEDAVKPEDKVTARATAVAALAEPWPMPVAIRIDGVQDLQAVAASAADIVVLPKVEEAPDTMAQRAGKPVIAMVETARAVMNLREIVAAKGVAGLLVGTNDLAADLRLPGSSRRQAMAMALQSVVCAARSAELPVWDGVFNRLDDQDGFEAECREGRALGFDGKSLIHPSQIDPCHRVFVPSEEEVARAERLIAAATGGAQRFEDAMIESMHVDQARRTVERARR
ncbi:CoA ester lyase [Sphingomonas piscis]|uniref:CoA ester lyase n=1 Tax=Sphingomonas piscis TaxID=2714943 RepID=A0A6G7YST2_9SPHN|nr:CoA ester lyase [Sphingomonas piscis]QIK79792.1 CoA ester lyase [Sphingomonas piscis]